MIKINFLILDVCACILALNNIHQLRSIPQFCLVNKKIVRTEMDM